jgi:hypothetical protein
MNAKEKTYMMALVALLLIGLSVAWAGYSSSITISPESLSDALQVSTGTPSLFNLKKGKWFQTDLGNVFTISHVDTGSRLYVTVGVLNMADLAKQFSSLEIEVELYTSGGSKVDSDVISLTGGISSVILEVDNTGGSPTYTVKVTVSGRPSVDASSINIEMYCSAIEA